MSWHDSGTANFVRVEYPDLTQVLELTDAGGPNEVLLPGLAERDRVRLTVTSRVDGVESAATLQMPQVPTRQRVVVGTMAAGIAVPAQGSFGDYLGIESRLDMYKCSCAEHRTSGIPVDLQARPTAITTWKTVGRFTGDTVAPFSTPIGSVGGRQFRLYVPATKRVDQLEIVLTPASSTSARSSKTLAKFDVAGFNMTSAQVGQMVKLTVNVRPTGTVKGALQRWDGKYWRSVLAVPITKGKAVMYVRAAGRGTKTYYRVAVPGMSYCGLPIETTGSRSFTLTVR